MIQRKSMLRSHLLVVWAIAALGAAAVPAAAAEPVKQEASADPVEATLLVDTTAVVPGKPFHAGVLFKIDEGWHIYWRNPGEAGMATKVTFQVPKGFKVGPLRWPRPGKFVQPGDVAGYGYEGSVLLTAEITPPANFDKEDVTITAEASWLACRDKCVTGERAMSRELPVADTAEGANVKLFGHWRGKVGTIAPPFTLTDHKGNKVSLSDHAGSVVVLEWFNPDCPFVKRHYRSGRMQKLSKRYQAAKVVWLTINSTHYMDPKTTADWHEKWNIPQPVLIDRDGTVGQSYRAKTTPHMFVIDSDGVVVYQGAIDNDPRGKREKPVNCVARALDELLAKKPISKPETRPYGCSVKYPPK